ncbi:hypothetical protein BC469_18400 [Vibrio parahaemolyticus]|nr:hypothetical protein [Vibrio parahaemolyticus]OQS92559.1 hypothetical protein EM58_023535 [Vibrio parahaemolyticus 98-513-F52]HAS8556584.1 hypothetical protein [Vibrio vulnificus]EGR0204760.1 hypothetical protein [Vibrio parahaemolyticus]EGR1221368.1 hypothetical protein [Vibrio parahaemolyticus]
MKRLTFRAKFQLINAFRRQIKLKRFEPKKITTNQPKNPMRQPANIGMFYGLSDSRIWDYKAKLPRNWGK